MGQRKIKLLKPWDYTTEEGEQRGDVGELFEVDESTAKSLVDDGIATIYDPEAEQAAKRAMEKAKQEREEMIQAAVAAALAAEREQRSKTVVKSLKPSVDPKGGFKTFGEFAQDVFRAGKHGENISGKLKRWVEQKTNLQEGDDAQGGYLVPTEFRADLLQTSLEDSVFTKHATFIPMMTNRIEIPAMFDTDHTGGEFFGGVTIYRTGEGAQKTKSKPTFGVVQLNLHKITGLAAVTDSLLEDSPISLGPILTKTFGQAMSFTMDDDFINGDGAGKPLGFLNCAALVTVPRNTASEIDTDDVARMFARMPAASLNKAIWLANHNAMPQLVQLTVGTQPVFMPPGGLSNTPYATLFGRPLFFTEKVPGLGTTGDICFVDPTQYLVGGKNGMEIQTATSIHLWFDYDLTAFRFVVRYDGVCWWKSAMTPKNGDDMSPFVTLTDAAP